jgi:hypothetical protein
MLSFRIETHSSGVSSGPSLRCGPPSGTVLAAALGSVSTCPARTILALQQLLAVPPSQAWPLADILLSHIQVNIMWHWAPCHQVQDMYRPAYAHCNLVAQVVLGEGVPRQVQDLYRPAYAHCNLSRRWC